MGTKKDQHVVPSSGGKWGVRSTGSEKSSKVFETKDGAVRYASEIAKRDSSHLYVHRPDGLIQTKFSYSNEPHKGGVTITYKDSKAHASTTVSERIPKATKRTSKGDNVLQMSKGKK